jgi:hypothetical protein
MPEVASLLDQCVNVVAAHFNALPQLGCLPQELQAQVLHAAQLKGSARHDNGKKHLSRPFTPITP